ncbi:MAG: hypothetical protein RLY86_1907 [Pseudomonadota bacterium]|jgi:predicted PurR-regulated permease PerM
MRNEKLIERILGIAALVILGTAVVLIVRPFVSALLLAVILVYVTWPAYRRVEGMMKGRPNLSAAVMTLLTTLLLVAPFSVVAATLAESAGSFGAVVRGWLESGPPPPPDWLDQVPLIGHRAMEYWTDLAAGGQDLMELLRGGIRPMTDIAIAAGSIIGAGVLELIFAVFVAFFLYRGGRVLAPQVAYGIERFAGPRVHHLLDVAGATVKGVIYGIVGTALAQGFVAGVGFWIAGVPGALFLGFLTFIMSLIPMGPPAVWAPVTIWLFMEGQVAWGVFMAIWGFFVISGVDNIIRPYLIARGSDLPLVLVFMGVIGGVLAFGVIGIFLGPVVLAVSYSLLRDWTSQAMAGRIATQAAVAQGTEPSGTDQPPPNFPPAA